MRYLLNLSYNGSAFYGFQRQNNKKNVQSELEQTLSTIFNKNILVKGCSRTDKGVHAFDQYALFESDKEIDKNKLKSSINKMIDKNIFVKNIFIVNQDFSIRKNVIEKEYIYKINVGEYNPIEKDNVFQYNKNINIRKMRSSLKLIRGIHDFTSFTSDTNNKNYIRNITYVNVIKDKNYVIIKLKSKGFLRYMIRIIVGLLLEINEGIKDINDIEKIFKSKDRRLNAKTASPCGLYLNKITLK